MNIKNNIDVLIDYLKETVYSLIFLDSLDIYPLDILEEKLKRDFLVKEIKRDLSDDCEPYGFVYYDLIYLEGDNMIQVATIYQNYSKGSICDIDTIGIIESPETIRKLKIIWFNYLVEKLKEKYLND